MNVMKLIAEVKQFPYLYDRTLPEYGDKDLQSRTWDIITANIYADQWNKFSYAEKAKKVKSLQSKLTPQDYANLLGINVFAGTSGSGADNEADLGADQDNPTVEDVQEMEVNHSSAAENGADQDNPTVEDVQEMEVNHSSAAENAPIDEDRELLLLYLLPGYKLLPAIDKRDVLHDWYCIMRNRLTSTTGGQLD
ncbi:Alcohol dehydrogenase transcription factor Myb/SANT-like [Popillia japonica]|uniref:Alcohol dehydrogenase transcription factor Myb/SANT-like n=1 Tax=Popillia japonica TaxID=7064 RepID=A0AAW1IZW2_POPJA